MDGHLAVLLAGAVLGAGIHRIAQLVQRCRRAPNEEGTPSNVSPSASHGSKHQVPRARRKLQTTLHGDVLPFSDFAACALLDMEPEEQRMAGSIYTALKGLALNFLRADVKALEASVASCGVLGALVTGAHHGTLDRRHSQLLCGERCTCDYCQTHEWVDAALKTLMRQLEVLLFEYCCYNWDREEEVVRVNEQELIEPALGGSLDSIVSFNSSDVVEGLEQSVRARRNWVRAKRAVIKYLTVRRLQVRRRFETALAIFKLLRQEGKEHQDVHVMQRVVQQTARIQQAAHMAAVVDSVTQPTCELQAPRRTGSIHGASTGGQLASDGTAAAAANSSGDSDDTAGMHSDQQHQKLPRGVSVGNGSADARVHQPVLLMLGGGMAAGKSTVRTLLDQSSFWSMIRANAVTVEADAIKNQDVIYRSLHDRADFQHDLSLDVLVHEYATQAAEAALVAAINLERDVVFDGTQAWAPFVIQTIDMVRQHKHRDFVVGPGYQQNEATGEVTEMYYLPDDQGMGCCPEAAAKQQRSDYRIELVGVCCHPALAVARGIWRRIRTGRSVPVKSQLRSHRLFAANFECIARKVDSATLYFTGCNLTLFNKHERHAEVSPRIIAHSSDSTGHVIITNNQMYAMFKQFASINDEAASIDELFSQPLDFAHAPFQLLPRSDGACCSEVQRSFKTLHEQELQKLRSDINGAIPAAVLGSE